METKRSNRRGSITIPLTRVVSLILFLGAVGAAFGQSPSPSGDRLTPEETGLLRLAHQAVRAEVEQKPLQMPEVTKQHPARAVFVTIERKGRVLGCRGGLEPQERTLEAEIVHAARSAAAHDPRYLPLTPKDLPGALITITIIEQLSPLGNERERSGVETLTPADGLVLRAGDKAGIVLPWEGKDPRTRVRWAYQKAGLPLDSPCTLQRMTARRFRG